MVMVKISTTWPWHLDEGQMVKNVWSPYPDYDWMTLWNLPVGNSQNCLNSFDHGNFEILDMVMVKNFWPFDPDT